nr:peptidyl-prolyl cis-trans isomerase [Geothrix sp. SG200]
MTEDQVRAAFLNQGEERKISHVLCRTEEEAAGAKKRIQAGEAFDAVAAECSIDPSAAKNRGDLGWIRRNQLVEAFGDPVFAAPVDALVGPLKTEYGWHVAKVFAVRTPKAEDFPAVKDTWMRQMAEALAAQKRESTLTDLRKRYPLKADLKILGSDRTTEPKPGDEKAVAGRVAGAMISLRDTKQYLAEALKTVGQSHSLGAATKASFMEGLADSIRLAAAAKAKGLDRRPAVRGALWASQRQQAYALFSEAYLATAKVADSDLKAHHEAYPDRFRQVGALRLQVLVTDSEDRVNEALARVRSGLSWRETVQRYGDAEVVNRPEPEWIEVASLRKLVPPTLLQPMLEGPVDQPLGPMLGPDGYMIFNVLERRQGPVMPLAECRDAVRVDYLKVHGAELVAQELDKR